MGVPLLGCVLSVPSGLAFYLMPAGEAWHVGSLVVPHAIGFYVLFGLTAVWWTAPVYTVLAEVVTPQRRATTVAFFNLGMTMVGGGLGPLLVGLLSDALVPIFGVESLRYALALTTCSCYALGVAFFYLAMQAYERERVAAA